MNTKLLRKKAAELARDCRTIDKTGTFTIREWNESVRQTVRHFMTNTVRFHKIHGTWEEQ